MQKFFETDLWGVLSVPFTGLVFGAAGISALWVFVGLSHLTWLVPS